MFWEVLSSMAGPLAGRPSRLVAIVLAVLLYVGFMIMPIAVLAGMVK